MASKKAKASPAVNEVDLDNMFEGITEGVAPAKGKPSAKGVASKKGAPQAQGQAEQDLLAELENLGTQSQAPSSRPHTPRLPATTTAAKSSPAKRTSIETPQTGSTRTSEEKGSAPRKSIDSTRSFHTSFTPSATSSELQENETKTPVAQPAAASGGGWWGGFMATASAAVKQAEAAVKEIQQNEEAKRWAEQVKGNVGALRGLGMSSFNCDEMRLLIVQILILPTHS